MSWKLSRTVLRGGTAGNGGSPLDTGPKTKRQPLWIHPRAGGLMLFAGLYESWYPEKSQPEVTFTIVTCPANAAITTIHDRMPVVLDDRGSSAARCLKGALNREFRPPFPPVAGTLG